MLDAVFQACRVDGDGGNRTPPRGRRPPYDTCGVGMMDKVKYSRSVLLFACNQDLVFITVTVHNFVTGLLVQAASRMLPAGTWARCSVRSRS